MTNNKLNFNLISVKNTIVIIIIIKIIFKINK